mmetsp:Transcript_15342/g.31333  ORF Transcript_15342/g.31333 Transcript_15342/m.31333 type:complete len:763 (+) Transcript_15342:344-2632(+)
MNPFDQFANDLTAALPPSSQPPPQQQQQLQQLQQPQPLQLGAPPGQDGNQYSLMAAPTQPKKPVMNAPNNAMQPGGMHGGMGMQGRGMYGQPPPQLQQQQPMYGGGQNAMLMPSQSMMGSMMAPSPMNSMNGSHGNFQATRSTTAGGMGQMGGGMGQGPPGQPPTSALPSSQSSVGPGALVPSSTPSNPYALGPFGGGPPPQQQSNGSNQLANPFDMPTAPGPAPMAAPPAGMNQNQNQNRMLGMDPFGNAPAPQPQQQLPQQPQLQSQQPPNPPIAADPWGAPAPPPAALVPPQMANDPWGAPTPAAPAPQMVQPPPATQLANDPWGAPAPPPAAPPSSALVPSAATNDDPFGIFGSGDVPSFNAAGPRSSAVGGVPQVQPMPPEPAAANSDPWADMGFGSAAPSVASAPAPQPPVDDGDLFGGGIGAAAARAQRESAAAAAESHAETITTDPASKSSAPRPKSKKKGDLPPGGEWYDAKIFTPTLGVMFFKPKELVDSLFLQTDKKLVDALDDRPVVAFIVEGSSARSAGVELGHVLLKVNGIDVKNPKEASRLIKEGPRPLPLLFYVPDTQVVVAEGEHMVKYNTKETGAPNSAKDWKPKYVVIGGIIAQPWMMNMYRSKSEYDIAVIETQARRPISVKVKQFSLQGARVQNDWQGPQMVKYKNKLHPWKYIVILPVSRNPIKIASPNLTSLKPVHEGIRRVLQAQQRDRGGAVTTAGPIRQPDSYGGRREDRDNDRDRERDRDRDRGYDTRNGGHGGY